MEEEVLNTFEQVVKQEPKDMLPREEVLRLLQWTAENYSVLGFPHEYTKGLIPNFRFAYSPEEVLADFESHGGIKAKLKKKPTSNAKH